MLEVVSVARTAGEDEGLAQERQGVVVEPGQS